MKPDVAKLTGLLERATSVPMLYELCSELTLQFGFDCFAYAVRVPAMPAEPVHFVMSDYPKEWIKRYDSNGYLRIDPIVMHALASPMPVIWDEIPRTLGLVQDFFDQAAEFGVVHGITAPLFGRRGEAALFSLSRQKPAVESALAQRVELKQHLHWFGILLHDAVMRVEFGAERLRPAQPLTQREKECLLYTAEGQTSAQIAAVLNIAERTVHFHIDTAGQKLGARGRHNILSSAISSGELELNHQALVTTRPLPKTSEYRR